MSAITPAAVLSEERAGLLKPIRTAEAIDKEVKMLETITKCLLIVAALGILSTGLSNGGSFTYGIFGLCIASCVCSISLRRIQLLKLKATIPVAPV